MTSFFSRHSGTFLSSLPSSFVVLCFPFLFVVWGRERKNQQRDPGREKKKLLGVPESRLVSSPFSHSRSLGLAEETHDLVVGEAATILDQVGEVPPELHVGDHLDTAGLLDLVHVAHTNGNVEEGGDEETIIKMRRRGKKNNEKS